MSWFVRWTVELTDGEVADGLVDYDTQQPPIAAARIALDFLQQEGSLAHVFTVCHDGGAVIEVDLDRFEEGRQA